MFDAMTGKYILSIVNGTGFSYGNTVDQGGDLVSYYTNTTVGTQTIYNPKVMVPNVGPQPTKISNTAGNTLLEAWNSTQCIELGKRKLGFISFRLAMETPTRRSAFVLIRNTVSMATTRHSTCNRKRKHWNAAKHLDYYGNQQRRSIALFSSQLRAYKLLPDRIHNLHWLST